MSPAFSVLEREAHEVTESAFGTVGTLHTGTDLNVWWVWKEREDLDPEWTIFSREDVLYVVAGTLKLEFRDVSPVVLEAGDAFVIPAGVAFRGYRWPRDTDEPCLFVAVSVADVAMSKEPIGAESR